MKLILSRMQNFGFEESEMKNVAKETKRFKTEVGYLQFRNAVSSYNTFTIVELLEDQPNQIIRCITPIVYYKNWDDTIFKVGEFFIKRFNKTPQILTANSLTLNRIDLEMGEKLMKEGKESSYKTLTTYECSLFTLEICLDDNLPDDYVCYIYDEQANILASST